MENIGDLALIKLESLKNRGSSVTADVVELMSVSANTFDEESLKINKILMHHRYKAQ